MTVLVIFTNTKMSSINLIYYHMIVLLYQVLISDQADNIGPRHGSQSDTSDSSAKLTGSWWGCYLHSSVPSVAAVYTILRQSARFRCRPVASSPSTLHVS